MSPAIDEDVKVWVAAKTIALETPEFSLQALVEQLRKQFRSDPKKVERFVTRHCVANAAGDGEPYFNYLFRLSPSKYRLFHAGDPIEYSHASAPTTPEVRRVPAEYKSLYSASAKLAQHMRAVPTTSANATPVLRLEPLQQKTKARAGKVASPKSSEATKALEPTTSGLKPLLSDLDESVPANAARRNLLDQLFLEMGTIGSRLEHARGSTFSLNVPGVTGSATSLQNLAVRLPNGGSISHVADLVVEIESP